jgi:hypothetical protein
MTNIYFFYASKSVWIYSLSLYFYDCIYYSSLLLPKKSANAIDTALPSNAENPKANIWWTSNEEPIPGSTIVSVVTNPSNPP